MNILLIFLRSGTRQSMLLGKRQKYQSGGQLYNDTIKAWESCCTFVLLWAGIHWPINASLASILLLHPSFSFPDNIFCLQDTAAAAAAAFDVIWLLSLSFFLLLDLCHLNSTPLWWDLSVKKEEEEEEDERLIVIGMQPTASMCEKGWNSAERKLNWKKFEDKTWIR